MKKTSTIKDVARLLNVSVSTVSRVMNGRDRVSDATRKKVMDAVQKLNYVPNYAAVSIVKKQTRMIVVLLPDLNTPFFLSVVQGIEETAKSRGYFTMIFSADNSREAEYNFINGAMGRSADGIIVVPSTPDLSFYKDYAKPLVFVDRFNDEYPFDCVVIDNFRGAYVAAEHLVRMGHKKIGVITGPRDLNIGKERYWGFEQALRDSGVKIAEEYSFIQGWTEQDGYDGALKLLKQKEPPTALFAANENICRGVIKAVHDMGLTLARDVSLIGFDDNELAQFASPQVTVISRASNEMGSLGASILLDKIDGQNLHSTPKRISLPTRLVERGSVQKLNQH